MDQGLLLNRQRYFFNSTVVVKHIDVSLKVGHVYELPLSEFLFIGNFSNACLFENGREEIGTMPIVSPLDTYNDRGFLAQKIDIHIIEGSVKLRARVFCWGVREIKGENFVFLGFRIELVDNHFVYTRSVLKLGHQNYQLTSNQDVKAVD